MFEIRGKYNTAKVYTDYADEASVAQIMELCNQPMSQNSQIRIMPDVHAGAGCTIGTTMTITDKIIPNLVGVDIGCGMETTVIKESYIEPQKLDKLIRAEIPSGCQARTTEHKYARQIDLSELYCYKNIHAEHALLSIGSLGGGNHFIEVDRDENKNIYLVIHSGSRHLGVEIARYYQEEAYKRLNGSDDTSVQNLISEYKAQGRQKEIEAAIKKLKNTKTTSVPKHLAYCEGELFDQYLHDMKIAQEFAVLNRQAMTDVIVRGMHWHVKDQFTTIHNYIDIERKILRKGSVSAQKDEILIIPMNMRDGSLICRGKGNPDWNCSAPHGAGRLMSRSQAKETCSIAEYKKQMQGIYTTSVGMDTLDECPMAYKPMQEIIDNLKPTAEIISIIKPIYNFKAGSEEAPWSKKK
ncbi:MAG: RtcB family protein [Oscillospiraceae bacterium]|nr:RtcB family protein [Oscillospiraceae bacterium]